MKRVRTGMLCVLSLLPAARVVAQEPILHSSLVPANFAPVQVDVADVDGDGRVDLVVLDGLHQLSVQLGDGVGGFGQPLVQDFGEGAQTALATADFDGDGLSDAVITRAVVNAPDKLRLLLAEGRGSLVDSQTLALAGEAGDLDALDLDGDGNVDVLAGNADGNRLSFYRGDGTGALAAKQDIMATGWAQDMAEGDLNGDGLTDIVSNSSLFQTFTILLANGSGGFGAPQVVFGLFGALDVQLGDVNGDGDLDAVAGCSSATAVVFHGNGLGNLNSPQTVSLGNGLEHVALADLDEDGVVEGLFAAKGDATVSVLSFEGPLTWDAAQRYGTGDGPTDLEAADVNGDGDLDLVVGNGGLYGGEVTILAGNGEGGLAGSCGGVDSPVDVAFGDLDADGRPDLVSINNTNAIWLAVCAWLNQGLATFGPRVDSDGGTSMSGLDLADLDGDGDEDIAAVNFHKQLFTYESNGDGTLQEPFTQALTNYAIDMLLADLDGDSATDLVLLDETYQGPTHLVVYLGAGDGSLLAPTSTTLTGDNEVLLLDDVTGDGELDALVATYGGVPLVTVLPGLGDGSFGAPVESFSFVQQTAMATGDLDEDGDRDLVATSVANGGFTTLRNDGGGAFTAIALTSSQAGTPRGIEVADFDRDGHLDVGVSAVASDNKQTGRFAIFTGHGDLTLEPPQMQSIPRIPMGTAVADVDGDGAMDLGVASLADQVAVLTNERGPWQALGYGLGGTQGVPRQIGEGTLQPGESFAFTLRDARPLANAAHVIGLTTIYAPFKGGTYVPSPLLVNYPIPTDATGQVVLSGNWPGPASPGLDLYFQFWIQDPLGPKGWASSGAVQATLP